MGDLRAMSTIQLKLEYIAAMCSCRYKDARAILAEIERREAVGRLVFEPVTEG